MIQVTPVILCGGSGLESRPLFAIALLMFRVWDFFKVAGEITNNDKMLLLDIAV